ncbi:bifunctional DNA primase/polymerase [Streptomyces sp. TRM 70361]|uniref:bifunctional DNA primase/polymerase n=1 Tax=Streptomyces sp. TRM 70361 TaxID=3116553 RepID=UPI002E7BC49C|nr:bifunctional DNA primase/polymerase [Streptomyces sp. TRM 70361]MEE1941394.1 bifunctional DNA primase/polymerase [Streptomyces sp. TRM 70361]
MNQHLLTAALAAAERGWHVFPLRPGSKVPAGHAEARCPRTGRCTGGHRKPEQRATVDPGRIRQAWAQRPYGIGVATGPSGLVVVDLDRPKPEEPDGTPDGVANFQALCERAGQPVPTTLTVRTASGGVHLYFTAPAAVRLPSTKGRLAPKIDTRAWGGYVVAPGSTVDGRRYEVTDDAPVAALTGWLLAVLRPVPRPAAGAMPVAATTRVSRYADAALRNETAAVAATGEGGRNAALLRAARALGRFVASGDLPRSVVEEALQGAGEAAGLPPAECRATLRSGLDWSIAHNPQRRTA